MMMKEAMAWSARAGGVKLEHGHGAMAQAVALAKVIVLLAFLVAPRGHALPLPSPFQVRLKVPQSHRIRAQPGTSPPPKPFIALHGIGDACANPGMKEFMTLLSKLSGGARGTCIEIGDGFKDSWTMRLDHQTAEACDKIKALPHLKSGFNIVGLSQGGLIGRALIQTCDGMPQVHALVSVGGPQAGVASVPNCVLSEVCKIIDLFLQLGIYTVIAQDNVAPAGYVKIPTDLAAYLKHAKFLPNINNEKPETRNATYAARFQTLQRLALIMFDEDTVLFPPETAHFSFFAPNTFENPVPVQKSALYKEDWIGLRALDVAGKVDFIAVPGNHLHLTLATINGSIVPYLR